MTDTAHTAAVPAPARKIDVALGAVGESQMQAVGSDDVDRGHVSELDHASCYASGAMCSASYIATTVP